MIITIKFNIDIHPNNKDLINIDLHPDNKNN